MRHYCSIGLVIFCVLITLCIPQALFLLQDHKDMKSQKDTKKDEELYKKYPVIAAIYADSYSDVVPASDYQIYDQTAYDAKTQKILQHAVDTCETQLQKLIDKQVVSKQLLMHVYDHIQSGSISDPAQEQASSFTLEQILSMDGKYIRSQTFTYLKEVNKISHIAISNEHVDTVDEKKCKQMAWRMISYLGLDKIPDWTYIDGEYESYQAKLKIQCRVIDKHHGYKELQIAVLPLAFSYEQVLLTG